MDADDCLDLRLLMTLNVDLDVPLRLGKGPYGVRNVFASKGGEFAFDPGSDYAGIRGSLVAGPADFCLRDRDTNSRWLTCDVRGTLKASQPREFAIYMHYSNCIPFDDKDADDLTHGKTIEFQASHFLVQPHFEVGDCDLDGTKFEPDFARRIMQLNGASLVAHGRLKPLGIDYRVYQVVNRLRPPRY